MYLQVFFVILTFFSFSDAIILPFVDGLTSLFAGCVIFSTLGYTAHISNIEIESVVKQGNANLDNVTDSIYN